MDNSEYEIYKKGQRACKNSKEPEKEVYNSKESEEGTYIGSVRTGYLCFNIIDWGTHLWFDLYVGGVDTSCGYSLQENSESYPFKWDKDAYCTEFEDFKEEVEKYIEQHIGTIKEYTTDMKGIHVSLIDKADEELNLW